MRFKALIFLAAAVSLSFGADRIILKNPPRSLDKFYPPKSEKYEFLSNMHKMSTAFTGIRVNVNDGNWEKALFWAKKLRDTYVKTRDMVPEWKDYFKVNLAENLVKAVESKDVDKTIEASQKLGKTCSKCHQENELAVKLTYRFPSFEKISLEDPIEFTELDTGKYMEKLTNSMKIMKVYLLQEEAQKAQEEGLNFVERARQLRTMCSKCHTSKVSEEAIFGKSYEEALAYLENLLSAEKPDGKKIIENLKKVTVSCTKCHNVHLVPAVVRETFGR